ncbi:hypothetical protein KM043_009091 [Ampulex compressa]|nr:hypothetical protein KM043_009091 [Ampulex compressa]
MKCVLQNLRGMKIYRGTVKKSTDLSVVTTRAQEGADTVQPNVQGQEEDSILTDWLVVLWHVTPGNTAEPVFHSPLLQSVSRIDSPTIGSDPEQRPITGTLLPCPSRRFVPAVY